MTEPADELSGAVAGLLVLAFVGPMALGWLWAGPVGALLGAGVGAFAGIVAASWGRIRRAQRMLEHRSIQSDRVLPPRQALAVMSGLSGSEGGLVSYRSELLARLEEIAALAASNPALALELARELTEDHPRSPAARAAVARALLASGDHEEGMAQASRAIALALDGGMNPAAATMFEEVADHRDALSLAPHHLERLARILENRQDASGTAWCRIRLERLASERQP
jgi:tetratricopeptide (TPR) repeat protein